MKNISLLLLILTLLAVFASCISRQYPVTSTYQETAYRTEYASETYTENETAVETLSGQYELTPFYSWYSQNIAFSGQTNVWYIAYDIPQTPPYDNIRLIVSIWKQLQYEPATISVLDMTQGGHLSTPAPATAGDTGKGQVKWTWITSSSSGTTSTFSSVSSTDSGSTGSTGVIGGASDSWVDAANTRINQALFLGGRTYLWSKQADPQIIEMNAGRAQKIGVIICGPQNSWNSRITVAANWSSSTTSYQPVTKERKIEKQVPYTVQKQKTIYETRQVPFWEVLFTP
ncbi:MAG: hypothetical protein NTY79_03605 [Chloroflexi bacterium]|nr:hypothetical protein [Chloroflexota bacterium]